MSKIARFFQKVFASNYAASPTGQIAQFGSLAGGTAAYSGDPSTIQALAAWQNGWSAATVGSKSPTFQDFNAFQFVVTQQLAYLLQAGIPEYDASTTYYIGSFCQVAGVVYVSIVDSNTGNAVTNPAYFKLYLNYATVATTGSYTDLINKPATFTSSLQAFPSGGSVLSVTHGLGAIPSYWFAQLKCITAESGYAVGDIVQLGGTVDSPGVGGCTTWANSTSIGILTTGTNPRIVARPSGALTAITQANWNVVFKAWA